MPEAAEKRFFIENKIRDVFVCFNYKEIRTPSFEKTSLFKRSIGEETDVVSKEMYSFSDDEFTLKPEMTAPVIRAYLENSLYSQSPISKLFYIAKMYRHENPQAGRYREFTQFGAEAIGSNDYLIDAEMISMGVAILESFGIKNIVTKINTIGDIEERSIFIGKLKEYLVKYSNDLSEDSRRRLEKNPLRVLDTKIDFEIEILKSAPVLYDYLNKETKEHFENVLNALKDLRITYDIDYRLVRGFDYYTSTTFEIISGDLGAQNAILGGGRYDRLIEQLGGKPTPSIGFASGMERLELILSKSKFAYPEGKKLKLFIATIGDEARKKSSEIVYRLRTKGIMCDTDYLARSVKAQMRDANKSMAEFVIVLGENEIRTGKSKLKRMADGTEKEIEIEEIGKEISN